MQQVAYGADCSFGVLDICRRELGVATLDLEPPEWLASAPPIEQRCVAVLG